MQLLKLRMRNFRRYRHQDVVFRDGITGILGNNGTGKSTIVGAVLFCLYGVKETGLEYILSATAGPRDRAEVRLDFSVRGEEYQIVRSLGPRKKHEAQLNRGQVLLAKGVFEVQDALRGILRMGQADFRQTIYSGQKELLALLDATPEGRKQWFRRVLGIDRLKDKGGDILRAETAANRDELLRVEGRLAETDAGGIQKALEEAVQGIAGFDREIGDLLGREKALGAARAALDEELKGHREREKRDHAAQALIEAQEKEAAGIGADLGDTRRRLVALEDTRQEFDELAGQENGFLALHERYLVSTGRSRTFREITARISEKECQMAEAEGELAGLRDEEARLRGDEERVGVLAPAVARRGEILARLAGLRSLEERSRQIAAGIERKAATLEELAKRGAALRARIERMREAEARLRDMACRAGVPAEPAADLVPALEARRQEIQQAIAEGKSERDHAARRIGELEENLSTLAAAGADGACPTCRQPLGARFRELIADIEVEAASLREDIAGRERYLQTAEEDLESARSLYAEAQGLREVCSQMEEAMADWTAIQDQTRREISAKEQLEEEAASLGYDPAVRRALEEELARLAEPWQESLAASERLKALPGFVRRMRKNGEALEKFRKEIAGLARERDGLGFDPGLHGLIEEEFRRAEQAHGRYLALKPAMEQLPVLLGQEKDLLARAATASRALEGLRSERAGIGFSGEDLRRVESLLKENSGQALEMGRCLERARAGKSRLEGERTRLARALDRLGEDTRTRDRLREEIALLELTRDQLNGFTDHLLGIVRDQIQEETGRILAEITDGRYDTVILDDAFQLLVHDLGGDFPVSRFSGGEQDDVAIALRIALSRYIAEMHELRDSTFLIFDEIFGSQDEERRGNIFRAFRALEPYFPQIFLISHVADIQGEFGNTLLVEAVSPSESRIRDLAEGGA